MLCCKSTNPSGFKDSNHKIYQSSPSGHVQESYWKLCSQVEWMSEPTWCTYWAHLVNVKARTNWHEVTRSQKWTAGIKFPEISFKMTNNLCKIMIKYRMHMAFFMCHFFWDTLYNIFVESLLFQQLLNLNRMASKNFNLVFVTLHKSKNSWDIW